LEKDCDDAVKKAEENVAVLIEGIDKKVSEVQNRKMELINKKIEFVNAVTIAHNNLERLVHQANDAISDTANEKHRYGLRYELISVVVSEEISHAKFPI
jgi:hypothetical protein